MKVAIIGCGNITQVHAKCINSFKEHELCGAADCDINKAVVLTEKYGGKPYCNRLDMIESVILEVVLYREVTEPERNSFHHEKVMEKSYWGACHRKAIEMFYKSIVELAHYFETPNIRMFSFYLPDENLPEKYRDKVMALWQKSVVF